MTSPLEGVGVLVTRPAHQAGHLCRLISDLGGIAKSFPTLEISPIKNNAELKAAAEQLSDFHITIFVSANAVPPVIKALPETFPDDVWVAAVGGSTASILKNHGVDVDLIPEQNINSEGLLAMDALTDVEGEKIVIFRGETGRELLADTLRERGADVSQIPVYRRSCPEVDPLQLEQALDAVQIITVTSNESLDNLMTIATANNQDRLQQCPLIVLSERMSMHAKELGFNDVHITDKPGDDAIVDALLMLCSNK